MILELLLFKSLHAEANYAKSSSACSLCVAIEKEVQTFDGAQHTTAKMNSLTRVTDLLAKLTLRGLDEIAQRHIDYVAINATVEILDEDFDSTSAVRLLDLRAQNEANFDYVFWRFPVGQQTRIQQRMKSIKDDKIRPAARLPTVKEVEAEN